LGHKASGAAVDSDDGARCGRREPISKNLRLSVYADVFFFNIRSSPPPLPLPPQTQINFEDRKINNVGNDCLMTIDGTDFRVPQTGEAKTGNWFASHKYAGKSALR
jgi:hypothetical protein